MTKSELIAEIARLIGSNPKEVHQATTSLTHHISGCCKLTGICSYKHIGKAICCCECPTWTHNPGMPCSCKYGIKSIPYKMTVKGLRVIQANTRKRYHQEEWGDEMPAKSKAQFRAMEAAAHGHSTLGIPKKVAKEYVGATKSVKSLPERKKAK